MAEILKGTDGTQSLSRTIMLVGFLVVMAIWLAALGMSTFTGHEWSEFQQPLTWGRDFFFVTVLPYIGNKFSQRKA
jgi:hypothetical protein